MVDPGLLVRFEQRIFECQLGCNLRNTISCDFGCVHSASVTQNQCVARPCCAGYHGVLPPRRRASCPPGSRRGRRRYLDTERESQYWKSFSPKLCATLPDDAAEAQASESVSSVADRASAAVYTNEIGRTADAESDRP